MTEQTHAPDGSDEEYPFHTAVTEDGERVCGVAFLASTGKLYEFLDPDTHSERAKYRDPRTGETIVHSTVINEAMAKVRGGFERARIPAEEWSAFREKYVEADAETVEEWIDMWDQITDDEGFGQ